MAANRMLIIPAAGRGTRLGGSQPKPLVRVAGRAMLDHLFALYQPWVSPFVVVVNPESGPAIETHCARGRYPVKFVQQREPTGMLDAILLAHSLVEAAPVQAVWVTWADQIAVRAETVKALAGAQETGAAMVLPVLRRQHPYTHLERDAHGRITAVRYRREGDPMPEHGESEIGVFGMSRETFLVDLPRFAEDSRGERGAGTGERNFLPFIPWLARRREVVTFPCVEAIEAVGVNTPEERDAVEAALLLRRATRPSA